MIFEVASLTTCPALNPRPRACNSMGKHALLSPINTGNAAQDGACGPVLYTYAASDWMSVIMLDAVVLVRLMKPSRSMRSDMGIKSCTASSSRGNERREGMKAMRRIRGLTFGILKILDIGNGSATDLEHQIQELVVESLPKPRLDSSSC